MIRINKNYLDKFKKTHCEYLYPICKGVYLAFDIDDLTYIGIEMFYLPYNQNLIDIEGNKMLTRLLSLDILETTL